MPISCQKENVCPSGREDRNFILVNRKRVCRGALDCYRKSRLLWWFLGGFAKKKIIVARGKITVKRQMYYIATRNTETPMRTARKDLENGGTYEDRYKTPVCCVGRCFCCSRPSGWEVILNGIKETRFNVCPGMDPGEREKDMKIGFKVALLLLSAVCSVLARQSGPSLWPDEISKKRDYCSEREDNR